MAKEAVTPMSLLNNLLQQMNTGGYNPKNRTKFRVVLGNLVWFVTFLTFILDGVFLFTNTYTDFGFIMIDTVLFAGFWQLSIKLWTLLTKHQYFLKVINYTESKFWSLNLLSPSDRPDIQIVYNIAKLAANSYAVCINLTLFGHYVTSYFRGNENLINNIWLPEVLKEWNRTPLGHHIIFLIEAITFGMAVFYALNPVDGIYIILIALVIGQLKIIKCRLRELNANKSAADNMKDIADCVEHHNMLFEYLHTIEKIFSTELLHVAGSIIILAVLSMYCCMVENDIGRIITYCLMFVAVNSQLFIYCFMGQLIQDETYSVADAAYECKWEDIPDKNVRFGLMLIILRSHKYVNITMGGLLILCLDTFTRVSRMMLSLLTFMMNSDVGK